PFTGPARPRVSPLSLHDALPISMFTKVHPENFAAASTADRFHADALELRHGKPGNGRCCKVGRFHFSLARGHLVLLQKTRKRVRSEEHTSELQSREKLVCRLLLE